MARQRKTRPRTSDRTKLVQTVISEEAAEILRAKAEGHAISIASYVRQVLYRHLGLIKEATPDA